MVKSADTLYHTPRLTIRRLNSGDIDAMLAVYGDAAAMRWVDDGAPLDRAGCIEWVAVTERNYATRGYGMSAVVDAATDKVVGFCGLVHPGGQPEPEIKYAFRREVWGGGLATETVRGMLAYGAAVHGLRRVIATVAEHNRASRRVLRKAGMQFLLSQQDDDGVIVYTYVWFA